MLERFKRKKGLVLLRQELMEQQCISHDATVMELILKKMKLIEVKKDAVLIEQDKSDNDIYFILAGRVSIRVKGRELAIRKARQHVGEMALIDPSARRSATVIALDDTVVAKVTERVFTPIANAHPDVWRRLALELGDRLRERSIHVRAPNPRPVIFIGSSVEGLPVARQIQLGLSHDYVVPTVWTDNVFVPGHGTLEDLEKAINDADFGILVCTPDDKVTNTRRKVDQNAPRDNVILELGMCLGCFGRRRTLIVRPRSVDLKIPTDLLGITTLDYEAGDAKHLATHVAPVCTQVRSVVQAEGLR